MVLLSSATIISSIAIFLMVIMALVGIMLFAKAKLMPAGTVELPLMEKRN